MTDAPLRIEPGEFSAEEILDLLRDGRRLVVELELLGTAHDVVLRYDGGVYYCDTPTQLHRHEDEAAMRDCIAEQGYGRTDG